VPLKAVTAAHFVNNSTVTLLLAPRRTSPSAETKPGKAPKNVDYVGEALQKGVSCMWRPNRTKHHIVHSK
jgi:hypothetical protein